MPSGKPGEVLHPEVGNWFSGGGVDWKKQTLIRPNKGQLFMLSTFLIFIKQGMEYMQLSVPWSIRAQGSFWLDFLNRIPEMRMMKFKARLTLTANYAPPLKHQHLQKGTASGSSKNPSVIQVVLFSEHTTLPHVHSFHSSAPGECLRTCIQMWESPGWTNGRRSLANWTGRKSVHQLDSSADKYIHPWCL